MTKQDTAWVIDDDQSIRWVLEKALQKAEISVRSFDTGAPVVEAIKHLKPDVILTDIRMPGMSGLDLLDALGIRQHRPVMRAETGQGFGFAEAMETAKGENAAGTFVGSHRIPQASGAPAIGKTGRGKAVVRVDDGNHFVERHRRR